MVMELMRGRERVAGASQKGSIMETIGVSIGSVIPGITFATTSHPNSSKTVNSVGSVCHSRLFCSSMSLIT